MKGFYYSRLKADEKAAYTALVKAALMEKSNVSFKLDSPQMGFEHVIDAVYRDEPYLFYVDLCGGSAYSTSSEVTYSFKYLFSEAERKKLFSLIKKETALIMEEMRSKGVTTDLNKCIFLHNKLVQTVAYDYDALPEPTPYPEAYRMDGVFTRKKAVCAGIARAYKYFCDVCGVPCMVVSGKGVLPNVDSDSNGHAWNIINLRGECVHVDVTWDIASSAALKKFRYDYFGLPDEWIKRDHEFHGLPKCTSTQLNYFYQNKRLFYSLVSLKAYLCEAIKRKDSILYFRICGSPMPDDIAEKIKKLVNKYIREKIDVSCSWQSLNNETQLCFYIYITYK